MRFATWARWIAIAIAVLAIVDPTLTRHERSPVDLVVLPSTSGDSAAAQRFARDIGKDFNVIQSAFPAAGTVLVGRSLPNAPLSGRIYVAPPDHEARIESIELPRTVQLNSRQDVFARIRLKDGFARNVKAQMEVDGVIVARDSVDEPYSFMDARFSFTPTHTGPTRIRVSITMHGERAVADAITDVVDEPWRVLVFDRRPSYMSTFVRRSLENDPRFVVASRIVTSKNISTAAGSPPSSLADGLTPDLYDVIMVGAPDALSQGDVDALDAFMRKRGGSVVLLIDNVPTPGPVEQLTGVSRWGNASTSAANDLSDDVDPKVLLATELAWPLDGGPFTTLAHSKTGVVAWRKPVGAGQLFVSSAMDAWKFRDRSQSKFDDFWRRTVGLAGSSALQPVSIELEPRLAAPGQRMRAHIVGVGPSDTARLIVGQTETKLPVMMGHPGEFAVDFRAPRGVFELRVKSENGATASARSVAMDGLIPATPNDSVGLSTLAIATGGQVIPPDKGRWSVVAGLSSSTRAVPWRPMHSWLWLPLFVGLVGYEWFARRRAGLA